MNDAHQPPYPPAPPPHQLPSSQRFPTWKQGLVMFFGGFALALSACYGCLTMPDLGRYGSFTEVIPVTLALLVLAGWVGTLVGGLFLLMRTLRALFGKKDEPRDAGSGSAS